MNEIRLWAASEYCSLVLDLTDMADFDHFRRGVLRREVSGDIAYKKQRDHSAHTLYNYLLGWYFYSHSKLIGEGLRTEFKKRGFKAPDDDVFADVWAFASLLHDIGYLFEGNLAPLSSKVQDDQVRMGSEVCQEYFSHRFWTQLGLAGVDDRAAALELSGVKTIPQLEFKSMTGLAYSLRSLGDLERLRSEVARCRYLAHKAPPITSQAGLPEDAFDLWRANYKYFKSDVMVKRIDYMEEVFLSLMQNGFQGLGIRVLDHGVCSGLILLLAASFYFRVAYGIDDATKPLVPRQYRFWDTIRKKSKEHDYSASWWWQGTVWASAATAIHNIAQMKPMDRSRAPCPGPLQIDDDPLAYLGILVDILQEWDRPPVARLSAITGNGPVQGIDVAAKDKNGILHLKYDSSKRAKDVIDSLNRALAKWEKIVQVES